MKKRVNNYKELSELVQKDDFNLSFTSLKQFSESPHHFYKYFSGEFNQTPAMIFGNMAHTWILEGEEIFMEKVNVLKQGSPIPSSKQARLFCIKVSEGVPCEEAYPMYYSINNKSKSAIINTARANFKKYNAYIKAISGNKNYIFERDLENIKYMEKRLKSNKKVSSLLFTGQSEVKFKGVDIAGEKYQGYIDRYNDLGKVDLKVYRNVKPRKFVRSIYDDKLYWQGAIYREYKKKKDEKYWIVGVDRDGNFSTHELHPELLDAGMDEVRGYTLWYQKCKITESWSQSYDFFNTHEEGHSIVYPAHYMIP